MRPVSLPSGWAPALGVGGTGSRASQGQAPPRGGCLLTACVQSQGPAGRQGPRLASAGQPGSSSGLWPPLCPSAPAAGGQSRLSLLELSALTLKTHAFPGSGASSSSSLENRDEPSRGCWDRLKSQARGDSDPESGAGAAPGHHPRVRRGCHQLGSPRAGSENRGGRVGARGSAETGLWWPLGAGGEARALVRGGGRSPRGWHRPPRGDWRGATPDRAAARMGTGAQGRVLSRNTGAVRPPGPSTRARWSAQAAGRLPRSRGGNQKAPAAQI